MNEETTKTKPIITTCVECDKPLTAEEYYWGHDCES